ncbi:MAG TPA: hypothetical protein VHF26_10735 [Trebonia sp.]|nr:hypothetical protein [Trebonia sp.]
MQGGAFGTTHLVLAETLGLAMARRAAEILERHQTALSIGVPRPGTALSGEDEFAADNAVFTAVLDAASECLGRFDARLDAQAADDRWCDALLQLIELGQQARLE